MKTLKKENFISIHDLFTYKNYLVKIDYDKKTITYDCSCYGNESLRRFNDHLRAFNQIDNRFKKILVIKKQNLVSLIESKTSGPGLERLFNEEIFGKIPFYAYEDQGDFMNEIGQATIDQIKENKKIEDRTKDFKARALKTGKIPKILKPISNDKIPLNFVDFIKLYKEDLSSLKKYFIPCPIVNSYSYSFRKVSLDNILSSLNPDQAFFDKALNFGFDKNFIESLETYKKLKTVEIFNQIGG